MRIAILMLLMISACSIMSIEDADENEQPEEDLVEEPEVSEEPEEEQMANTKVLIKTNKGDITVELYDEKAPVTTANFKKLVEDKFYDGLTWHRYVEGFVIQGGDPDGDGTGGSKDKIKLEVSPELKHVKGALGMARSQDPDSASSQFYISLEDIHGLDMQYAVFGIVTEGMDVALQLRQGDTMEEVKIIE